VRKDFGHLLPAEKPRTVLRTLTSKLANTAAELRASNERADALLDLNAELVAERDPNAQTHAAQLLVQIGERDRVIAGLRASEEMFRQIAANIHDALFILEADTGKALYVSPAYDRIWGCDSTDVPQTSSTWIESVHEDDRARVLAQTRSYSSGSQSPGEIEFRIVRCDGELRWISSRIFPVLDERGLVCRAVGTLRDITEIRLAAQRIEHLSRVHSMLSGINALIVRATDRAELLTAACRLAVEQGRFKLAWCGMVQEASGDLEAVAWAGDMIESATRLRLKPDDPESLAMSAMRSRVPVICNDLSDIRVCGVDWVELVQRGLRAAAALPLVIGDVAIGCVVLITDEIDFFDNEEMKVLSEFSGDIAFAFDHIAKADRLNYLAYYDSLTGLANRALFQERLAQQIGAAQRAGTQVGIALADAERFNSYNETFGRAAADQLLRALGERFAEGAGGADLAGRIGSDQFAAIIPAKDVTEVGRTVEDLERRWLGRPFDIGENRMNVSAKVGVAIFPADGHDAEALLRNAERALRNAKQTGKRHSFYTPNLSERIAERLTLERSLRTALANDQFVLHYQPKVDLEQRRICGVEALLRWRCPELGLVAPAKFVPLLEESGLIVEVGDWALRQATLDRAHWRERGLNAPRVAVNVSMLQLQRDDFVRRVLRALRLAGGEAGIDIEVTESVLMTDVANNLGKLTALQALGVGIALDDFGTGYSSLGYLAKLPVQTLKIDRSFIATMLDDPGTMTLVSTIISLAAALRLETVAEGVESEEQAKILRLLRCGQMQGFLVSKPLTFDEMTAFLGRNRPVPGAA
jgi:diguanylate cyclase (GGDEF)-like protein/PAS domain S-box-containing protein